ncbi:methionine--tRNA ligase [Fuerstiella marisgermanici]|uniref:Methionine--tRNA ligase n=1 Tax=Fuerstiella marisgermanici TaxID=1891926 RepID=A0A1P8WGG0_9PLAN|nr:methionine--tRNA ligase [Fuerstiella marisgermanici]APZ93130.1 Methionine--tRNA ligase [Fuerstiella marisgermanici]
MTQRRILVTSALPYANGHIHIGHLVEYIQTDIWVRFQKLRGHQCVYVCADDTHGTAIMIRARNEGRSEEEVIADMRDAHIRDFATFHVEFDNYGSTNSDENREMCGIFWESVNNAGLVTERDVDQLYDTEAETFLADRFVKGKCPECGAIDQYGDACEKCMATYAPEELLEPYSTLSGSEPVMRTAPHKFIQLEKLHPFLNEWVASGKHLEPEVANYIKGQFLSGELRDWDVTRPPKYFGFEVPGFPGHSWYVWFDAPIGYLGSTKQWCDANGENFDAWWKSANTEVHHFIGKDITYFHTLFWPGLLKTAGFNLPEKVRIHGFLTVAGEKMSKSRGTFVMASTYAKHLPPGVLRYYYASKLGSGLDDIDLNLEEFVSKVNSDLVGKVVNLASRSAKFVAESNLSETYPDDGGLFAEAAAKGEHIASLYEDCNYNAATREIMLLADKANKYVEDKEPWVLRKDPDKADELRDICTVALNLFRQIVVYLSPVLPELAKQTGELLNKPIEHWDESQTPLTGTPVSKFQHLMKRIEEKQVNAMIEDSKEDNAADAGAAADAAGSKFHAADTWKDSGDALEKEPMTDECTIDDFVKVDLRVARIIEAGHVEGANKLLQLTLSLGGGETRNVFAGIKAAYEPESLVGRLVVCVANLKPRQMKFGLSEGMVCASGGGGKEVFLLSPDEGSVPGQRVH